MDGKFNAAEALRNINLNLCGSDLVLYTHWCQYVICTEERKRLLANLKFCCHRKFVLNICIKGSCTIEFPSGSVTLERGEYLLIPPGAFSRITSESDDFEKLVWCFSLNNDSLTRSLDRGSSDICARKCDERVYAAIDIIMESILEKNFLYYDIIKAQLLFIFASVTKDITDVKDSRNYGRVFATEFDEVKAVIRDNIRFRIDADHIAMHLSMTVGNLERLCKKHSGLTVSGLIRMLRFSAIKEMLGETTKSLEQIAVECGFADRYSMSKFFKKFEGIPPAEYRATTRE